MSVEDLKSISEILNKTNYRVLAWYYNPNDTERCGLRDFKCLGRMPMQSTGGERFTVYVYFRTQKYVKGIEAAWDTYDEESADEEVSESEHENDANDKNRQAVGIVLADSAGNDDAPILLKASKYKYMSLINDLFFVRVRDSQLSTSAADVIDVDPK